MLINASRRNFNRKMFPRSPFGDTHPQVLKWRKNARNAGSGAISSNTMKAMDWFYKEISKYGIAKKIISMNCYAPDNLIAAITPLIHIDESIWTNVNFVSSDLNLNGLIGGASKYLNTNVNPNLVFPNDLSGGYTLYSNHPLFESTHSIGSQTGGAVQAMVLYYGYENVTYWDCWNSAVGRISATNTLFQGFISTNRISDVRNDIYTASPTKIHSSIASSTNTAGSRPNFSIYMHSVNSAGTPSTFSARRYSFAAIHYGLSFEESSRFYYCIHNLRIKLGGGFVT